MTTTIDVQLWRSQSVGQCCRPRRCTRDMAKRHWYATHRTRRLARLGDVASKQGG